MLAPPPAGAPRGPAVAPAAAPAAAVAAPAAATKELVAEQSTKVIVGSNGGFFGETGLFRVTSAEPVKPLGLRIGAHGEFFYLPDFLYNGDTTQRQVGDVAVGLVPLDNFELFILYQTMSTRNSKVVPPLQLSQGNITWGAKYAYPFVKHFSAGAFLGIGMNSEPGQSMYSIGATSFTLKAIATFDGKPAGVPFPFRAHANAGAYLIASDQFGIAENDRYLHYMLNINEQKQGVFGLAVDFPLEKDDILPFVEVTFAYPDGPGYATPGVKWQPLDGHGLTVDLYAEFGLFRGTPALAPTTQVYNIIAGLSYGIQTTPQVKVVKERVVERVVEKTPGPAVPPRVEGFVKGLVVDVDNESPLGNAIVTMLGTGLTNLATDPIKGDFASPPLRPGQYNFVVEKTGYEPGSVKLEVRANETSPAKVGLKRKIVEGDVAVKVVDAKGKPVPMAEVQALSGGRVVSLSKDDSGRYSGKLDSGAWYVVAKAEGKLALGKVVEVKEAQTTEAQISLKDRPKTQLVIIEKDRIQLKKKIQFKTNSAQITGGESFAILDSVADAINSNPRIRKVRIEGHTDDKGEREANVKLSRDRANSCRDYLLKAGIAADMLEANGFGPDKPIESNKTNRGREANRRVEFHVAE